MAVPPGLGASLRRREDPVRRAVRHVWNVTISLLLGGAGAAGVLFFSYYLDDTGR
jgi:hypothetical protein